MTCCRTILMPMLMLLLSLLLCCVHKIDASTTDEISRHHQLLLSQPAVASFIIPRIPASGPEQMLATNISCRGGGAERNSRQLLQQQEEPANIRTHHHFVLLEIAKILNAASKWILAGANLFGVYRFREEGAFLVIGCILACFATEHGLKPMWNQARPANAPLADPGMPSSHSLASFFVAMAWTHSIIPGKRLLFGSIATLVASLRILCGYHTLAQISVGAILGISLGHGWMTFVWQKCNLAQLLETQPIVVKWWIWSIYGTGSVLFIWKIMSKWISQSSSHIYYYYYNNTSIKF
jgi:membrane-associated phospholipid phosphatase